MTDDISKVDAVPCSTLHQCSTPVLCASVGTCKGRHVLPAKMRAAFDRLESAGTPAEVGVRRYEADVVGDIFGPRFEMAPHATGDWVAYDDYATLARQLAEAKVEIERLDAECRQHMTQALNNGQAALQAESQLAEATRRLGEVEGLLQEWLDADHAGWIDPLIDRTEAALTKEPTK